MIQKTFTNLVGAPLLYADLAAIVKQVSYKAFDVYAERAMMSLQGLINHGLDARCSYHINADLHQQW